MTPTNKKDIKRWIEAWKRADSALKEVKQQELRSYDYEKNRPIIDDMLQWTCDHQRVRLSSGLVEQQRLFMKIQEQHNQQ